MDDLLILLLLAALLLWLGLWAARDRGRCGVPRGRLSADSLHGPGARRSRPVTHRVRFGG